MNVKQVFMNIQSKLNMQGGARANPPAMTLSGEVGRGGPVLFGPAPQGKVEVKLGQGAQKSALMSIQ